LCIHLASTPCLHQGQRHHSAATIIYQPLCLPSAYPKHTCQSFQERTLTFTPAREGPEISAIVYPIVWRLWCCRRSAGRTRCYALSDTDYELRRTIVDPPCCVTAHEESVAARTALWTMLRTRVVLQRKLRHHGIDPSG
jgi:hypothetical protein